MNNYHYFQIETQFIENYGAHSEPATNHWKFKGGETYFIKSGSPRIANAVAFLATYLQGEGKHSVEIPVHWQECSKGYVDSFMGPHMKDWEGGQKYSVLTIA